MGLHHRQGLSDQPGPPKHSHTSEKMHISSQLSETDMKFRCESTPQWGVNPPWSAHWALGALGKYPLGIGRPGSGNNPDF